MATKRFPMHAILTMNTGIVFGPFGVAHELMEWVLGHPVWTHEMPSYMKQTEAKVAAQFPKLPTEANASNYEQILESAIAEFGEELDVEQGANVRTQDPIETAVEMFGEDKVIPVIA